jgi:uncharacterized protein involved in response to NO
VSEPPAPQPVPQPLGTPPRPPTGPAGPSPTPPFLWAAVLLALLAGFGLGGALFLHQPAIWRVAAAQAHGHVQLFGWAGLLVLGVGLHFLPRLRGAHLAAPRLAPLVLLLYTSGLVLRVLAQPLAAYVPAVWPLLPLSGLLELAGAGVAIGMLVATARRGQPLAERGGLVPVLPYLAFAWTSLGAALVLNLIGLALLTPSLGPSAVPWSPLMPSPWHALTVHLGFLGFLVPISIAVSVRTFPLYLRVRVPRTGLLWAALAALVAGLVLRLAAVVVAPPAAEALGRLLEGAALLAAAWLLDVPLVRTRAGVLAETRRRAVELGATPRPPPPPTSDLPAAEWLLRTAYAWLVLAAALLLVGGVALLADAPQPPLDAERHALGAGFVTLLIFGMGARLLPGFVGRGHVANSRLVWATLWLGNAAALLRVAPLLLAWLLGPTMSAGSPAFQYTMAVSGLLDTVAVGCFGWNLWRTLR